MFYFSNLFFWQKKNFSILSDCSFRRNSLSQIKHSTHSPFDLLESKFIHAVYLLQLSFTLIFTSYNSKSPQLRQQQPQQQQHYTVNASFVQNMHSNSEQQTDRLQYCRKFNKNTHTYTNTNTNTHKHTHTPANAFMNKKQKQKPHQQFCLNFLINNSVSMSFSLVLSIVVQ